MTIKFNFEFSTLLVLILGQSISAFSPLSRGTTQYNTFHVMPSVRLPHWYHHSSNFHQKRSSALSPLFVATANMTSETSSGSIDAASAAHLRSIENQMEKYIREKQLALKKLNSASERLHILEMKKKEYLDGIKLGTLPEGGNFSETTVRSAVKAFAWRMIAGLVTLISSLQFSGSLRTALSIVGSDFFSKALTMFIGERLMNKSQAGRKSGSDDVGRSLIKALIWRLFAISNTLTMALFIARDLSMASKIAGTDAIFKTFLMFVYERVWAKIEWGKEYVIEFSI